MGFKVINITYFCQKKRSVGKMPFTHTQASTRVWFFFSSFQRWFSNRTKSMFVVFKLFCLPAKSWLSSTPLTFKLRVSLLVLIQEIKNVISFIRTPFPILEEACTWVTLSQHDERNPLPSQTDNHIRTCKKNKKIENKN